MKIDDNVQCHIHALISMKLLIIYDVDAHELKLF